MRFKTRAEDGEKGQHVQCCPLGWLTGPLRTDRQAHIDRKQYLRHSPRSLCGDKIFSQTKVTLHACIPGVE